MIFTFTRYVINIVFSLIEIILLLRFVLRLFGANILAPFVRWIYKVSSSLVDFFWGAFPTSRFNGEYVLEWNTLFALLIYTVIYYAISQFLAFLENSLRQKPST